MVYLMGMDKYVKIDQAYFEASTGHNGMLRVHNLILNMLPNADDAAKTPKTVLASFQKHAGNKLLVFAGSGASTIYSNVTKFVKAISEGSSPAFQGATDGGFMKQVMTKLLNFARMEVASDGESGRILTGKDAVQFQFQQTAKMAKPGHKDINMMVIFGWCLSKADAEQVSEWRKQLSDGKGPNVAAASSSSSAEVPVKAGTAKAKDKSKVLDDMTRALFRR